jgi:hypothetical protein
VEHFVRWTTSTTLGDPLTRPAVVTVLARSIRAVFSEIVGSSDVEARKYSDRVIQ